MYYDDLFRGRKMFKRSFAMDRMHDELLKLNGNGSNSKEGMIVSSVDDDAWEIVGRKNKSAIVRTQSFVPSELSAIFGGQLECCESCSIGFGAMWAALFGWIFRSSLVYVYGLETRSVEELLIANGREYPEKIILKDGLTVD